MKECILTNGITSVVGSNENTNYPWTNVLNDHPKWVGQAANVGDVTLTLTIDGVSNAFALFNTDAITIDYTLRDGSNNIVEQVSWNQAAATDYFELVYGQDGLAQDVFTSRYHNYPDQVGLHTITLVLNNGSGTVPVSCGIARAGAVRSFPGPDLGLREQPIDYSVEEQFENGSFFYFERDRVRSWSGNNTMNEDDYFQLLLNVGLAIGKRPIPWKIIDSEDQRYTTFARFGNTLPSAAHPNYAFKQMSVSLIEVI